MNCKRNSMNHPEPRQTVAHGEHSPTPEGEILFLGFKISVQLEQKRGGGRKKAVPKMMSVFPLLHRETMSLSYFKDEILVLIFLPVVCVQGKGREEGEGFAGFFYLTMKISRACISWEVGSSWDVSAGNTAAKEALWWKAPCTEESLR